MATDISKNTLFVLVILTLIVSVLGTWTVLNNLNAPSVASQASSETGQVQLVVAPPQTANDATGQVVFNIEPQAR